MNCVRRRQCLVFYSQGDESKFSTPESFGEMFGAKFNSGTSAVDYWACSRQKHQNDSFHYHCALKLTRGKK